MQARAQRIEDILLCYLQSNHAFLWPGADGCTLHEARDGYLQAMQVGLVPSWQELARRYPESLAPFDQGIESNPTFSRI